MRIDVVSIFPEYLAPLRLSLIGKAIEGCGIPTERCSDMDAAVRWCAAQVQAVARTYFGDDQLTAAILVPQPLPPGQPARPAPAGEIR